MQTSDIEQFNPTMAELITLASQYKDLTINGVDDKEGYNKVHKARVTLKDARVSIQKTGKLLRADALKFQKAVIEKERELIALIEPIEIDLGKRQDEIDEQKEKLKRLEDLPRRREKIKEIDLVMTDDELLAMDSHRFDSFMFNRRNEYLDMKEKRMKAELEAKAKLEAIEREAKMKAELELLNMENAKIEAAKRKLEEEKAQVEREKQRAIDLENAKIEAEKRLKQEEEAKLAAIEAEKVKLEKKKTYQKWLADNGWTEETKDQYQVSGNMGDYTLWKKISFIKIS